MTTVKTTTALAALSTLVLSALPAAVADDAFVLANSKARKLQVLAEGGGGWCKPTVHLRMVLESDSPDLGSPAAQVDTMNRLRTPLTKDCKTATAAEVTVIEAGKPTGTYKANADQGWFFVAAPAIASPASPSVAAAKQAESPMPAQTAAVVPPSAPPAPELPSPAAPVVAPLAPPAPVATVTVGSAASAAPPLPKDIDYAGAVIRVIKDNPSLVEDDGVVRCWAEYRYPRVYSQYTGQEFKIRNVLQRAKADLSETVTQNDGSRITAFISTSFQPYDFDKQHFPIDLGMESLSFKGKCRNPQALPNSLIVKVADINAISGLPMEATAAQVFAEKRTTSGSINRNIAIAVTVKLDAAGFTGDRTQMVATGALESATIYADSDATQLLYRLTEVELDKLRAVRAAERAAIAKAEDERKAEQRRQQLVAQQERHVRALASAAPSVRLANMISDGQIDYDRRLNDLRNARGAVLIGGKPVMVSMLIQADGSGRNKVGTQWPGKLEVTVADGQPALRSSGWYLVRGPLSVPEGDGVPPAQLTAQAVYACEQSKCADAMDANAIVARKLAAMGGAN